MFRCPHTAFAPLGCGCVAILATATHTNICEGERLSMHDVGASTRLSTPIPLTTWLSNSPHECHSSRDGDVHYLDISYAVAAYRCNLAREMTRRIKALRDGLLQR